MVSLGGFFFLFAEALFSYQSVGSLTGRGFQRMFGFTEEWEGMLAIKETVWTEPWGSHKETTPSNLWLYEESEMEREMRLTFSGFQANIEIQIRL